MYEKKLCCAHVLILHFLKLTRNDFCTSICTRICSLCIHLKKKWCSMVMVLCRLVQPSLSPWTKAKTYLQTFSRIQIQLSQFIHLMTFFLWKIKTLASTKNNKFDHFLTNCIKEKVPKVEESIFSWRGICAIFENGRRFPKLWCSF